MNLRVDLLLETERRSASVISTRSIIRIATIVIPSIIVLGISMTIFNAMALTRNLEERQATKASLETPQKEALAIKSSLDARIKIKTEMETWRASPLPMKACLLAIQSCVPAEIQFQNFSFRETVGPLDAVKRINTPARVSTISINGRVLVTNPNDTDANRYVIQFQESLLSHPELTNFIDSVKITDFRAPDQGSGGLGASLDPYLIFSIEAILKPRKLQ